MPDSKPVEAIGEVDRVARLIAGKPPCFCPDDWREDAPEKQARCPQHGSGEWPVKEHRAKAHEIVAALSGGREQPEGPEVVDGHRIERTGELLTDDEWADLKRPVSRLFDLGVTGEQQWPAKLARMAREHGLKPREDGTRWAVDPDTRELCYAVPVDCTCGNGEAEEDRGAVLRCPVHGQSFREQPAGLREAEEGSDLGCPHCGETCDVCVTLNEEVAGLRAEAGRLRPYLRHKNNCAYSGGAVGDTHSVDPIPCDCGLAKVFAAASPNQEDHRRGIVSGHGSPPGAVRNPKGERSSSPDQESEGP